MPDRPSAPRSGRRCQGLAISPGVAWGPAFLYKHLELAAVARNRFPVEDVARETGRLHKAVAESRVQLQDIQLDLRDGAGREVGNIFGAHLEILGDQQYLKQIVAVLERDKVNIEYIIANQIKQLEAQFAQAESEFHRNLFLDIQDVYHRLLRNLLEIEHVRGAAVKRLQHPVVFVSEKLIPSDLALLAKEKLLAVVIEEGSRTSHVAIIARSLGVPAVINVPGISSLVKEGDVVLVDGEAGTVLVNPRPPEIEHYAAQKARPAAVREPQTGKPVPAATRDGAAIHLLANVNNLAEVAAARDAGAAGIGLLRTEFFYMSFARLPTEEEETDFLVQVLRQQPDHSAPVVRLLDLGADKALPYLPMPQENNPQLGCRGLRYLLRHPDVLARQLRSVARASREGKLRILLPFITMAEEWDQWRAAWEKIARTEPACPENVQAGIMVEIPALALQIGRLIPSVDFVSIGTNDLAQYAFAASREDPGLEEYRPALHPVILGLVRDVVTAAAPHGKDVTVCGEIAADPLSAGLLAGLGVGSLSMFPEAIPGVRRELARRTRDEWRQLAERALTCFRAADQRAFREEWGAPHGG